MVFPKTRRSKRTGKLIGGVSFVIALLITVASPRGALGQTDVMIELGGIGADMAFDEAREMLYVTVPSRNAVLFISTRTLTIVNSVIVGSSPQGLDLSIDGSKLFIALSQAGSVIILEIDTLTTTEVVVGDILGNSRVFDVVEGRQDRVFVSANPGGGGFAWIVVIKLDQGNATARVASNSIIRCNPTFEVSPDHQFLYVGECFSPNSLDKLDLTQDDAPIVLSAPFGGVSGTTVLEANPDGSRLYLGSGQVLRTGSLISAGQVGAGVHQFGDDPDSVFVASTPNVLKTFSTTTFLETSMTTMPCSFSTIKRLIILPGSSGWFVLGDDLLCGRLLGPRDCNGNGIGDDEDIAAGTSMDCNTNDVPDECDIADGTSLDCQPNGIPDECELADKDCNTNGIPDDCDIDAGTSADCNANGIPDACDLAAGTSQDTNGDGFPDECEIDVKLELVVRQADSGIDLATTLPLSDAVVAIDSTFVVELWATDRGMTNTGLIGVFADLTFTPGVVEAIGIDHRPPFNLLPSGTIDNAAGAIIGLGGNDGTFGCVGIEPNWVRVAVVQCQSSASLCTVGANLALHASTNEVSACGRGAIPLERLCFGATSIVAEFDCVYDKTEDGFVNAGDLGIFAGSWLTSPGNPRFDPRCDFDCNGFVAAGDLGWFAGAWLRSCGELTNDDLPPCRRCVTPAQNTSEALPGMDIVTTMGPERTSSRSRIADYGPLATNQVLIGSRVVRAAGIADVSAGANLPRSDRSFNAGEDFYFEVWARDNTDQSHGLTAVFVDVALDPSQVGIGTIDHGSVFSSFSSADVGQRRIGRLGGANLGEGIGVNEWTRVAVVQLSALVNLPNGPVLRITPSNDGVSGFGRGTIPYRGIRIVSPRDGTVRLRLGTAGIRLP